MQPCSNCGASIAEDLDWCGLCYTRVERRRSNLVLVGPDPILVLPDPSRHSYVRPGATSFGIVTKLIVTGLVAGVGVGAYLALRRWIDVLGRPGWAFGALILTTYTLLALVGFWGLWKPSRGSVNRDDPIRERIIVIDGALEDRVEAAYRALEDTDSDSIA